MMNLLIGKNLLDGNKDIAVMQIRKVLNEEIQDFLVGLMF
jgi:hypothetical protein